MAEQPYNYYIWLMYLLLAIFGIGIGGLIYTIFNSRLLKSKLNHEIFC